MENQPYNRNKQVKKVIITFAIAAVSLLSTNSFLKTSWSGSNSTNKFNISYLIGAGGACAGKATGLNVVPVVYTVTQQ